MITELSDFTSYPKMHELVEYLPTDKLWDFNSDLECYFRFPMNPVLVIYIDELT